MHYNINASIILVRNDKKQAPEQLQDCVIQAVVVVGEGWGVVAEG